MNTLDDLELAEAIMKGDEKVFNHFFNDYYPKLFRFIMSRIDSDNDLADDLTQQTLCQAIDKMHTFEGRASLFTWMCQISRSLISAHFKKQKRRSRVIIPITDTEEFRDVLDNIAMSEESQPENLTESQELNLIITEILDRLPNNYGNILEWKYVENMSVDEIAEQLNTTMISVQSSLARARKAFQQVMNQILQNDKLPKSLLQLRES